MTCYIKRSRSTTLGSPDWTVQINTYTLHVYQLGSTLGSPDWTVQVNTYIHYILYHRSDLYLVVQTGWYKLIHIHYMLYHSSDHATFRVACRLETF